MTDRSPRTRMDDLTVERVLRVVEAIPPGRVAAYGEVGAIVGVGPRLVGRIMRTWGSSVPWWRVTDSYGDHPLLARALPHWQEEGIVLKRAAAHRRRPGAGRARWGVLPIGAAGRARLESIRNAQHADRAGTRGPALNDLGGWQ